MKTPTVCECGCGQSGHPNEMTIVRSDWTLEHTTRPGRAAWRVRKSCREAFEAELMRLHAVDAVVRENLDAHWWRRLAVAAQIHDLQRAIHLRRCGPREAARVAWETTAIFVLPRWCHRWLPFYGRKPLTLTPVGETNAL